MNYVEAVEILDGLMLGDGSIRRSTNAGRFMMSQSKRNISMSDHIKWLDWLRDSVFAALGIEANSKLCSRNYKGAQYQYARLCTKSSAMLAEYWDEWYVGGAVKTRCENVGATKVLPRRMIESSCIPIVSLVHWYLGDGGSCRYKKQKSTIDVALSTQGFSKSEVYQLIDKLNNMGISTVEPRKYKHLKGSGLQIRLSQDSIDYFMSLVEPHVFDIFGGSVKGLSYKSLVKYKYASSFRQLRDRIRGVQHC